MPFFLVNQPALDYITLTSFNQEAYLAAQTTLFNQLKENSQINKLEEQEGHLLQYKGKWYAIDGIRHIFFGQGVQGSRPHFLVRASGQSAVVVQEWLSKPENAAPWSASRIEVQLTTKTDLQGEELSSLFQKLNQKQYEKELTTKPKGRRVQLTTDNQSIQSNLLSIGARSSDKVYRCYVKDNHIRFEVELKGKTAHEWMKQIKVSNINDEIQHVLSTALESVVESPLLEQHRLFCKGSTTGWKATWTQTSSENTLKWFQNACVACADRLLEDESTRDEFIQLVDVLANKTKEFRRNLTPNPIIPEPMKEPVEQAVQQPTSTEVKKGRGRPRKIKPIEPN